MNIFAEADEGLRAIVEKTLDDRTRCELCLEAAPPATVRVKKLYGDGAVLVRK